MTFPAETEASLVKKAQEGDRSAYGELVRRHYQGVMTVVYRLCGDMQLAEDAAQDTFIKAWQHLSSFQPASSLRNWLYRIAVNAALDVLRRKPETTLEDIHVLMVPDADPGPEGLLLQQERAALVQQAIMSLAPASRAVLVLREYEGLSYREIAVTLDIPLGTVMSRLNYARNRLRELLEPAMLSTEVEYA